MKPPATSWHPPFAGGNGTAIVSVRGTGDLIRVLVVGVDTPAPADHVHGIVVEQLQLRGKLGDIAAGAGARGQQLAPAAPETGQRRLGPLGIGICDLIALIQRQHDFLIVLLDLPFGPFSQRFGGNQPSTSVWYIPRHCLLLRSTSKNKG